MGGPGIRLLVAAAVLLATGGCGNTEDHLSSAASGRSAVTRQTEAPATHAFRVIALFRADTSDPFDAAARRAFSSEAAANNIEVVPCSACAGQAELEQSARDAARGGMDGAVICPSNRPAVQAVAPGGMPVVTMDVGDVATPATCRVQMDHRGAGAELARVLVRAMAQRGTVLIVTTAGSVDDAQFAAGARDLLARAPAVAAHVANDPRYLSTPGGAAVRGILVADPARATEVRDQLRAARRTDIAVAMVGDPPAGLPARATAMAHPEAVGRIAAEMLARYLKGDRHIPRVVAVPFQIVEPASARR